MNWLSGLGLGLLSPAWLVLAPLGIGVLVYAYLRRGTGRRVVVGTLYLLKTLRRPSFSRKKFTPPPRFYLEVVLLLALALAAAGLYREGFGSRIAIVLDNSLSMTRSNPRASTALSGLDIALRDARSLVQALSRESSVEVFVTSPHLRSLSGGLVRAEQALQHLAALEPSYAPDNLDPAVTRLLSDPSYDKVAVFSDHPMQRLSRGMKLDIHTVNFDQGAPEHENVAIAHLSVRKDRATTIEVGISAFVRAQAKIRVILEAVSSEDNGVNYKKLAEKSVTFQSQARESVSFDDIAPRHQLFRVRIEPDSSSLATHFNWIKLDDSGWLSVAASGGRIALISQFSPNELGLNKIPFADFEQISPEQFDRTPQQLSSGRYLAAIFHRYVPTQLPSISSVFISPVSSSQFLTREGEISGVGITRWLETHPVLTYVHMPSLELAKAQVLRGPAWSRELIVSSQGPIAFAGEVDARKYLGLGFELLPFEGRRSALTSILMLNIIKYVSDLSADSAYQPVGSRVLIPDDAESARYIGEDESIEPSQDQSVLVLRPGILEVRSRLGASEFKAFNYFDPNESNSLETTPYSFDSPTSASEERGRSASLAGYIALASALILLVDLLLSALLKRRFLAQGGS